MAFGYHGERICLVPLDPDRHLESCYRWINDPEMTQYLAVGDEPMSLSAERKWFEGLDSREGNVMFAIETLDGRYLGNSGIHQIDRKHGTAITGSFIGDEVNRGQGYGTDAARLRTWYAFHVLGLRMLYSSHLEGNARSARMQEKAGYRVWGIRPKAIWKRGRFVDIVETYLSRDDWEADNPAS